MGQQRGVIGSPHIFIGDDGFFCPTLDIQHVDGELRIRLDRHAFDAFSAKALGVR